MSDTLEAFPDLAGLVQQQEARLRGLHERVIEITVRTTLAVTALDKRPEDPSGELTLVLRAGLGTVASAYQALRKQAGHVEAARMIGRVVAGLGLPADELQAYGDRSNG